MDMRKKVMAIFFLVLIVTVGYKSKPINTMTFINQFFRQDDMGTADYSIELVKEQQIENLWKKSDFIDLNGMVAKYLQIKGYYSDLGIYLNEEGYIVSAYPKTTTDYEYSQLVELNEKLKKDGIDLLYVNAPIKYLNDNDITDEFGIASYKNQDADLLLKRLQEAGVQCLDLRDEVIKEGKNIYNMFFKTDHHWKVESGLWATDKIVESLNEKFEYDIDTSIYDENRYVYTEYDDCWLGEQGKKLAASYVGLDDFTVIRPLFETEFVMNTAKGERIEGSFDIFIDESRYSMENDVYENKSWYYSYMTTGIDDTTICNSGGYDTKILLVADSYSNVIVPFLSLSVSELKTVILRQDRGNFDLATYAKEQGIDTVVVCYAEFMIGAHDDVESSNYNIFNFKQGE